jgi:hypothetical protein
MTDKLVDGVLVPMTPEEEAQHNALLANMPPQRDFPNVIFDRQFFQALAQMGECTKQEALDAVKTGTIPAALQGTIDAMPTEDERFNAQMLLSGAVEIFRDSPMLEHFRQAHGWTVEQTDEIWRRGWML